MIDLGSATVQAIAHWLEERGSFSQDSPLFIALDSAHSGHRLSGDGICKMVVRHSEKCWYQKTDVSSPHQTQRYHGGTGRNRRGCTEGAEVKQAQEFKHSDDL
jgi:site-specific recombinase XerC